MLGWRENIDHGVLLSREGHVLLDLLIEHIESVHILVDSHVLVRLFGFFEAQLHLADVVVRCELVASAHDIRDLLLDNLTIDKGRRIESLCDRGADA